MRGICKIRCLYRGGVSGSAIEEKAGVIRFIGGRRRGDYIPMSVEPPMGSAVGSQPTGEPMAAMAAA